MQHASVYLYSNKVDVYINPVDSNLRETFNKVYNRNLNVSRGVDNTVELRIKNSDQRPAIIGNDSYLVFNLTDSDDQQSVLQKDCLIKDRATGIASVTLTEDELVGISPKFYDYSIVQEKRQYIESGGDEYVVLKRTPTYMDTMFDMKGMLEVRGNIFGELQESVLIDKFMYYNPRFYNDFGEPSYYESSIVNANTGVNKLQHTFQFYFNDFDGQVIIQASTEEQGATPKKWSDIEVFDSTGENEYRNIEGKFTWFRIKYLPADIPTEAEWENMYGDSTPLPEEYTIKKVLYR